MRKLLVRRYMCEYCGHQWLRHKKGEPTGCPKCHNRFVGKKAKLMNEVKI